MSGITTTDSNRSCSPVGTTEKEKEDSPRSILKTSAQASIQFSASKEKEMEEEDPDAFLDDDGRFPGRMGF